MDVTAITRERLQAKDQRVTPARIKLAGAVAALGRPVTIAEILEHDASFAMSSTYRNLTVLEAVGVIHRIVSNDDTARYELAETFTGHHHHLMCERCGAVIDVPLPDLERAVHDAAVMVEASHGFATRVHRIDFIGRCTNCA